MGSVLTFSKNLETFWIFGVVFFNVSRCNDASTSGSSLMNVSIEVRARIRIRFHDSDSV